MKEQVSPLPCSSCHRAARGDVSGVKWLMLLQGRVGSRLPTWVQPPYLNVAKVNVLVVEMGTVCQPGKGTSRSREPGGQRTDH